MAGVVMQTRPGWLVVPFRVCYFTVSLNCLNTCDFASKNNHNQEQPHQEMIIECVTASPDERVERDVVHDAWGIHVACACGCMIIERLLTIHA